MMDLNYEIRDNTLYEDSITFVDKEQWANDLQDQINAVNTRVDVVSGSLNDLRLSIRLVQI